MDQSTYNVTLDKEVVELLRDSAKESGRSLKKQLEFILKCAAENEYAKQQNEAAG